MDCCSLEGRTLKTHPVVKLLSSFVLIKLEPLKNRDHKAIAERFGARKYPALLLLDEKAEKKLGLIGDVPAGKVVAGLKKILGK